MSSYSVLFPPYENNLLTLSAHAREGYSSHFVCLSVCLLFYCGEGAVFGLKLISIHSR